MELHVYIVSMEGRCEEQVPNRDPFVLLTSTVVSFAQSGLACLSNRHIPLLVTYAENESMRSLLYRIRCILEALYDPNDPNDPTDPNVTMGPNDPIDPMDSRDPNDPFNSKYHPNDPFYSKYHRNDPINSNYHRNDPINSNYHRNDPINHHSSTSTSFSSKPFHSGHVPYSNAPQSPIFPIDLPRLRRSLFFTPLDETPSGPFPYSDFIAVILRSFALSRYPSPLFDSLPVLSLSDCSLPPRDSAQPAGDLLRSLSRAGPAGPAEIWSVSAILRAEPSPAHPLITTPFLQFLSSAKADAIDRSIQRKFAVPTSLLAKQHPRGGRREPVRLEECLRRSIECTAMEVCDNCGKASPRELQSRITQLPPVLVILLKRFSFDFGDGKAYGGGRRKITERVSFPLEGLDMAPYTFGCEETLYDLVSVCNHTGSADFGHYYAYALCDQGQSKGQSKDQSKDQSQGAAWFEFNDSFVHSISQRTVESECAYYLVYRQRARPSLRAMNERIRSELTALKDAFKPISFSQSMKSLAPRPAWQTGVLAATSAVAVSSGSSSSSSSSSEAEMAKMSAVPNALNSEVNLPPNTQPSPRDFARDPADPKAVDAGMQRSGEKGKGRLDAKQKSAKKAEKQEEQDIFLLDFEAFHSRSVPWGIDGQIERECRDWERVTRVAKCISIAMMIVAATAIIVLTALVLVVIFL